jgi:hypothetical protein
MNVDPVSKLREIDTLETEIKRLLSEVKKHRSRKNELNLQVIEYLKQNSETEIVYKKKVYSLIEVERRSRKKESEKRKEAVAVITEHIDGPEIDTIYEKIKESFKGPTKKEIVLKVLQKKN